MKKMIQVYILLISMISLSAYGDITSSNIKKFGVCTTQNDSMQMMVFAGIYSTKLQHILLKEKKNHEFSTINELLPKINKNSTKFKNYNEEMTAVGRIINAKKYQEACDTYIAISKKYGGDIEEDSKTTVRIENFSNKPISQGDGCSVLEANMAIILFTQEADKKGKLKNAKVAEFLNNSALIALQNPNQVCKELKLISSHVSTSYKSLMQKTKETLRKGQERIQKTTKIHEKNEKNNKICSRNDAIALNYKQVDFSEEFYKLEKLWQNKYTETRNARLKNSKLIKILHERREKVDKESSAFRDMFKKDVEEYIDENYDLACENYKILETKYKKNLLNLQKDYDTFDAKKELNVHTKKNDSNHNTDDDALASKKYNYLVNIVNIFTPKIRNTFQLYAAECGVNTKQRTRPKVDAAMAMFAKGSKDYDQKKAMYDKAYGYHLVIYYDGSYKDNALKQLDDALSIDKINYANKNIKAYKESILEFMKLYDEAFTYYDMQDYTEDHFKKANTMHAPLITAYEKVIKGDTAFRNVIDEIASKQILKRINHYKENNQMMFYYVEKSLYLSKKFLKEANQNDYTKLDSTKFKQLNKELRSHYSEFKAFKAKNETIFKDNGNYTYYLKIFREYVASSKRFYIRVKEKKPYDFGEKMLLNSSGRNNIEGSIYQLTSKYNRLVNHYNSLNI